MMAFVLSFGVIGFFLTRTFAASPLLASVQGEAMTATGTAVSSVSINSGGPAISPFAADKNYTTSNVSTSTNSTIVSTSGVTNPAPAAVYKTGRYAKTFSYNVGGLNPTASYSVRLHFAEFYWSAAGKRVFNVSINGAPVLSKFDIYQAAGGSYRAIIKQFNATSNSSGVVTISFTTVTDNAFINAIEIIANSTTPTSQIVSEAAASNGQELKLNSNAAATGSFSLPSAAASMTVVAKADPCSGIGAAMTVKVDGSQLISVNVSSTALSNFSANTNLAAGNHTLSISYTNDSSLSGCDRNLYIDVTSFYGPQAVTPPPTVNFSASPATVAPGQASTLTWNTINATSCMASGAWTGSQPTSGSVSTAAINANSTYSLSCSGAGGTTTMTTNVSVVVDVSAYGAVGNGTTDDTAAIQNALNAVTSGQTLLFDTGKTYLHSAVLYARNPGVHITGSATLAANNESLSAFWIGANDITVDGGLTFKMLSAPDRFGDWENHKLVLFNTSGVTVKNVTVDGSCNSGIYVFGSSNYLIQDVTVQNTNGDGIHNTGGSYNGSIVRPIIRNTGDDGIAVISYLSDGAVSHDITVQSPRFYGNTHGRGFSVVGGQNITFNDIYSDKSSAAGLYISSEKQWDTYGISNVKVIGGTLLNSNTDTTTDHGAVLIYNSEPGQTISGVDIENLTITNTRSTASRQIGILGAGSGGISRVTLKNFTISGGPSKLLAVDQLSSSYDSTGWKFNGVVVADHIGW